MRSLGILIMVIGLLAIAWNTVHIAGLNLEPAPYSNESPTFPPSYLLYGFAGLIMFILGAIIYRIAARKLRINDVRTLHFGLK